MHLHASCADKRGQSLSSCQNETKEEMEWHWRVEKKQKNRLCGFNKEHHFVCTTRRILLPIHTKVYWSFSPPRRNRTTSWPIRIPMKLRGCPSASYLYSFGAIVPSSLRLWLWSLWRWWPGRPRWISSQRNALSSFWPWCPRSKWTE